MKKEKDIVDNAVNALKNEDVSHHPPQETVDAVNAKLSEAGDGARHGIVAAITKSISLTKVAAAVVLLIAGGFLVGRLTSPRPPDLQQLQQELEPSLRASLQPAIRDDLLEEMKKRWHLALAASYAHLKEELSQQFCSEMNRFGVQILAASGAVTNQRLTELTESIDAALQQIELNRLQDSHRLMNDLASFAYETEDELERTREEMAQFLVYNQPGKSVPNESKKPATPK